jgi:uncharacterized YigZ family protein
VGRESRGCGGDLVYSAPVATAQRELRDRGSRFLAVVAPAASEAGARAVLEEVAAAHPDATHHCWAWRLGSLPAERSSDAGEPAGTAGVPILQVLRGAGLSDVMAVVVRWFGGTKLGKGGLARAYAGATREAVAALATVVRAPTATLVVELPYDRLGALKRLVHPPRIEILDERYGASVRLVLSVFEAERAAFEEALADLGLEAHEREEGPPAAPRSS